MWSPVLTSSTTQYEMDIHKLRATEMIKGLEHFTYEERLRLRLRTQRTRVLRREENVGEVYCYVKAIYRAGHRERAKGNDHKLEQEKLQLGK